MELTQEQIEVLSQNLRKKHLRIELLNHDMVTIDSIEGMAVGGTINASADNDIRRSGNIELALPINLAGQTLFDKLDGFTIEAGGKIWLDKNIKIFVGIEDINSLQKKIVWFKLGVFLIDNPTKSFSSNNYVISFSCIDLMARLTGQRQGQLTGQSTIIEKGYYLTENDNTSYIKTKLADALIHTITELAGINKYTIYKIPTQYEYLPYDIKMGVGSTVYSLLKELMNIIPTWEMFFDLDGIFVVRPIPDGQNDIIYPIDETQYISNDLSVDFQNVKNQVVVYGKLNNIDYFTQNGDNATNVVIDFNDDGITSTLKLYYSAINLDTVTISGTNFGFQGPNIPNFRPINSVEIYNNQELVCVATLVRFENSTSSFGTEYSDTYLESFAIQPNELYFIRIYDASVIKSGDGIEKVDFSSPVTYEFMGKQSPSYCLVNTNKQSPFYINKNYEGPNYYVGMAEVDYDSLTDNYVLRLPNTDDITSLENGTIITFMANHTSVEFQKVNIYNSQGRTIISDALIVQNEWEETLSGTIRRNPIAIGKLSNDYTIWALEYEKRFNRFVLLGRHTNALTKVCSGGEYDNIYSDQLAYERCEYELFLASNMKDSITLGVVPNYILDVNNKIKYNANSALPLLLKQFNSDSEDEYYMIKQISYPLGISTTSQNISAIRIYKNDGI